MDENNKTLIIYLLNDEMFTMGEIKQNIATTNGEINNDLFLINLLLLYKLNLSLFILHIPPPRGGGGCIYIGCGTRGM